MLSPFRMIWNKDVTSYHCFLEVNAKKTKYMLMYHDQIT